MSKLKKLQKRELDDSETDYKPKKLKTIKKVNKTPRNSEEIIKSEKEHIQKKYKLSKDDKTETTNSYQTTWEDHVLLSEWNNIDERIAKNLIKLFENGNTIPFIARYRKNLIGNITIEELKDARDKYVEINNIKSKGETVIKALQRQGQLTETLQKSILNSTSVEEIDYIYAPYKPENKKTLAARAIALGLEEIAMSLIKNNGSIDLKSKINKEVEGLENIAAVEKGIIHILSHIIATDTEVLTFIRQIKSQTNFVIEAKKCTIIKTESKVKKNDKPKAIDTSKFENYFDFKSNNKFIKHHQVLAINRGEAQKVLSVKVIVPEFILQKLTNFCYDKWIKPHKPNDFRRSIIEKAVPDSYTRLIKPLIVREIRNELKVKAEKASVDVFVQNLKQRLLTPPIKGQYILGIDPGFGNGCKVALISETGSVLETDILYPHANKYANKLNSTDKLKGIILNYKCKLIAIGNGTACRETETWISNLISEKAFYPLDISYTIVNESGASIYSCSTEARKEFSDLNPNLISAVSLARRIQEPLAELVKVEPKHLGIGMYQHDLPKKYLETALDEVVSECVSFVGVDLNTTSPCLLRRVAGLSDKKAVDIIAYREKNVSFKSREEILKVKGIGKRIYEQCAGFLRVGPINKNEVSEFYKIPGTNKLDCTDVHPESYKVVDKLLKKLKLKQTDIGTDKFIKEFQERVNLLPEDKICEDLKTEIDTFKLIKESLMKPLNYDFRSELSQTPLFKKGLTNITDLRVGSVLTGRVENCTQFGYFIDIGVGCNGLLHSSKTKGITFQIGDQIEVKVINIDVARKRIGLEPIRKIS